jgi:uncharacterized membrane protein
MQNIENNQGKTALGLDANIGALICYVGNLICSFGLIYSIIVVVTDKTNRLVRFHAFQSILCSVLGIILSVVAVIIAAVAGVIDGLIGFPLFSLGIGLVLIVVALILFVMFIKAALSAYRGEMYKISVIGNLAESWSKV